MSKYVKIAHPMPTPSLTNHDNPQQFDFRPMISTKTHGSTISLRGLAPAAILLCSFERSEPACHFGPVVVITTVHLSGISGIQSSQQYLAFKMPEQSPENLQVEAKDAELDEGSVDKEQEGETKAQENVSEGDDNKKKEPYDAMRHEPHLINLIVESYLGEKNDLGFFHGYGTAYFRGSHVYSGSFVNGLMHGKGQYIWANGIKYEGDFKNNVIEGSGVYTWADESTYEGEVKDGLRHGQGTFICGTIPSSYTGEWKHGKRSGEGTLRYGKDGLSYYDGHWVDNKRHGFGMRRYASGNIYKGDWRENVRHGTGTMHWYDKNERYEGHWENGVQHGRGEHSWYLKRVPGSQYPLRNYYVGEWVNGLRHGYGTFYFATGAKYVGEWMNNMKHGHGKYVFKNGLVFEGKSQMNAET